MTIIIRSRNSGSFFVQPAPFHKDYFYPENLKSSIVVDMRKKNSAEKSWATD
jgi:hypothetical protein